MTQSQKYKKAFAEAQKLATLRSEVSTVRFTECLEVLHWLTELWESGQQAAVICTKVDNVEEDTNCDNLDIITEPGTTASDLEAEASVIDKVQSAKTYI